MAEDIRHVLTSDVVAEESVSGGFVFLTLHDIDDGARFQIGEDEILLLHKLLEDVIKRHNLKGC